MIELNTTRPAGGARILAKWESANLVFGMQPPRYDEIFRMVDQCQLDPSLVFSEQVSLGDISAKLEAMTDFGTIGIPVVDEF